MNEQSSMVPNSPIRCGFCHDTIEILGKDCWAVCRVCLCRVHKECWDEHKACPNCSDQSSPLYRESVNVGATGGLVVGSLLNVGFWIAALGLIGGLVGHWLANGSAALPVGIAIGVVLGYVVGCAVSLVRSAIAVHEITDLKRTQGDKPITEPVQPAEEESQQSKKLKA